MSKLGLLLSIVQGQTLIVAVSLIAAIVMLAIVRASDLNEGEIRIKIIGLTIRWKKATSHPTKKRRR